MDKYIEKLKLTIIRGRVSLLFFFIAALGQVLAVSFIIRGFESVLEALNGALDPYIKKGTIPAAILDEIASPQIYIILFYLLAFSIFLGFIIYLVLIRIPKLPAEVLKQDPVNVMIGDNHARDILGEIYETVYRNYKKEESANTEYLIQMHEEVLRRYIQTYHLKPIGKPGEGPIPYNPMKHIGHGNEKLQPGNRVFIVNIGWEREGKIVLRALVSTQASNKKADSHGNV